ncbi:NUDIX domain-containing protein [Sphingomonas sp. ABOLE]|uniref:NUDIX hydrolase n=1 Tax=Sphingomonas sp. ABOLE TaxID=1985878 RepID=UPI000F7F7883|nr:NUDIX domain-containing protein [Sphingomonas sp. ABOLE]RSV43904.1 NUDIX domain-containing protein [Sphingomonas sp. ABOLE]
MSQAEAIPAATVIVMREVAGGPPELLMVERSRAMAFAGGALVFPGGRIDPGDHLLTDCHDDAAARVAAIRETIEEAGLALGLRCAPGTLATIRAALHAGEPFAQLLTEAGLALDLDALVPFARWLPYGLPHRVFDTRFYLARAPEGVAPEVDGSENVRLCWITAQGALDLADRGEAMVIYPTRRNLERLALFDGFDSAMAQARRFPIEPITPFVESRGGVDWLCIPEGLGYPVTAERMDRAVRA